jgi:prolyl oligopeptidase
MAWVRAEDAKRLPPCSSRTAATAVLFKEALEIAEAKGRIPDPQLIGGRISQSLARTPITFCGKSGGGQALADYRKSAPAWTTILDLDALAAAEKANWFLERPPIAKSLRSAADMIGLSDGGEDAVYAAGVRFALGAIRRWRLFASPRPSMHAALAGRR